MLLNMAIMKFTKKIIRKKKIVRHFELVKPDLIGLNCKDNLEMEEEFLEKKVHNLVKVLSYDVEGFIKKVEYKLEELYGMVSKFRVDKAMSVSYREMVGDEVRCKLMEWKKAVSRAKAEYRKWRSLDTRHQLLLIQLQLDLDECKYLVSVFVERFETMKSSMKVDPRSPVCPSTPTIRPRVGTLINL